MLSRVAETIYWMSRYVERAENMARLINVSMQLQLDLPRNVQPGWAPLIAITGNEALFDELYADAQERNVVRFLVGELKNPSSILSALQAARENARTIREIIPREAWEAINDLYLNAKANLQGALSKRGRYDYLRHIIASAHQLGGLFGGTMTHDHGYAFLRMGRNLERADMTTRIIDVRSASLLPQTESGLTPYDNIQWMSVLKSLTAYQMYRREMQIRVSGPDVVRFLLQDPKFPRSVYHAIFEVENCLRELPRSDTLLHAALRLKRMLSEIQPAKLGIDDLHQLIDELQIELANLNDQIAAIYFAAAPEAAPVTAVAGAA